MTAAKPDPSGAFVALAVKPFPALSVQPHSHAQRAKVTEEQRHFMVQSTQSGLTPHQIFMQMTPRVKLNTN